VSSGALPRANDMPPRTIMSTAESEVEGWGNDGAGDRRENEHSVEEGRTGEGREITCTLGTATTNVNPRRLRTLFRCVLGARI